MNGNIQQSGLIGNCQFAALAGAGGAVEWLCWPRFDSSFVFGSLLDGSSGGEFKICSPHGVNGAQRYVSNTNVLVTHMVAPDGEFEIVDFAPRFRQFERSYRPTMLIRIVRPVRGNPKIVVTCRPVYEYGNKKLTPVVGSNHIEFQGAPQPIRLTTDVPLTHVLEERTFVLNRSMYFVLTWGAPLEAPLPETCEQFLGRTIAYWQRWVKHCHLPDFFQRETIRSALVLKLHQFEDTGAIVASTTTSIPEAPGSERNWDYRYCWIRDACFTVRALGRLSHFEELEGLENYLRNILANSKNRLQPVYGISGEQNLDEQILQQLQGYQKHGPVRVGNQAFEHKQFDVYGEMLLSLAPLYTDVRFGDQRLNLEAINSLLNGIEMTLGEPDAGIWELRGKQQVHTFTQLMHWAGARQAKHMARLMKEDSLEKYADALERRAAMIITDRCRDLKSGRFTQAENVEETDAALLMLINLGFLKPSDPAAADLCKEIEEKLHLGKKLIRRYAHPDDFGKPQVAFVVCTFWLAEAFARIGDKEAAVELIEAVLSCSNSLGLLSEDIDVNSGAMWGNYPQTYSHVGLLNAAFALGEAS